MIKFENPNNGRFYYLTINKDMLNECVLRIVYGGKHSSRTRAILCDNRNAICNEIDRLSKKRIARGYVLIT